MINIRVNEVKKHIEVLERRRVHLLKRISNTDKNQLSYDRAEISSLTNAIDIMKAFVDSGVMQEAYKLEWNKHGEEDRIQYIEER